MQRFLEVFHCEYFRKCLIKTFQCDLKNVPCHCYEKGLILLQNLTTVTDYFKTYFMAVLLNTKSFLLLNCEIKDFLFRLLSSYNVLAVDWQCYGKILGKYLIGFTGRNPISIWEIWNRPEKIYSFVMTKYCCVVFFYHYKYSWTSWLLLYFTFLMTWWNILRILILKIDFSYVLPTRFLIASTLGFMLYFYVWNFGYFGTIIFNKNLKILNNKNLRNSWPQKISIFFFF